METKIKIELDSPIKTTKPQSFIRTINANSIIISKDIYNSSEFDYNFLENIDLSIENKAQPVKKRFPFKKESFKSKLRLVKDSQNKHFKGQITETVDLMSYNTYNSIEVGPSLQVKRKYCDITGFYGRYYDRTSQLRYFSSDLFRGLSDIPDPIREGYLSIRKALFILK